MIISSLPHTHTHAHTHTHTHKHTLLAAASNSPVSSVCQPSVRCVLAMHAVHCLIISICCGPEEVEETLTATLGWANFLSFGADTGPTTAPPDSDASSEASASQASETASLADSTDLSQASVDPGETVMIRSCTQLFLTRYARTSISATAGNCHGSLDARWSKTERQGQCASRRKNTATTS